MTFILINTQCLHIKLSKNHPKLLPSHNLDKVKLILKLNPRKRYFIEKYTLRMSMIDWSVPKPIGRRRLLIRNISITLGGNVCVLCAIVANINAMDNIVPINLPSMAIRVSTRGNIYAKPLKISNPSTRTISRNQKQKEILGTFQLTRSV